MNNLAHESIDAAGQLIAEVNSTRAEQAQRHIRAIIELMPAMVYELTPSPQNVRNLTALCGYVDLRSSPPFNVNGEAMSALTYLQHALKRRGGE